MFTIKNGDCLDLLKNIESNSIDSIVTDPPYGIDFLNKGWDKQVPGVDVWKECLRVLKPGGYLLSFAGTRTQHRMATNIEDAGFEIRDVIAWAYGSGFPKNLDVSKAIDKKAPRDGMFEKFAQHFSERVESSGKTNKEISKLFPSKTGGLTGCVSNWKKGANVPTQEQWEILQPLLNLSDDFLPLIKRKETEREVVEKREVTDIRGGFARISTDEYFDDKEGGKIENNITKPKTPDAIKWEGWGTALKPAMEPITVARKPFSGTVSKNVLENGTGAININASKVGERFPANIIHDGSDPFDDMLGHAKTFFYCPKTSKKDRGEGNNHPTVKPTDLMRYLCTLVTQPGGTVLDPFTGSGSTGRGAIVGGFNFIGFELDSDYCEIATKRIKEVTIH